MHADKWNPNTHLADIVRAIVDAIDHPNTDYAMNQDILKEYMENRTEYERKAREMKTLTTYEDWPKAIVTKQTYSECAFILRGTDRGRPAWHCILVPASQIADLNAHPQNTTADITKFGSIIQYLNNRDQIILTSGWGIDPPRMIQEWIEEHYSKKRPIF
ncbi:unnamed protein product [Rotaria sp. Silwood1]|nr:unnamed protein product [Rotaria sp. Silwood1]